MKRAVFVIIALLALVGYAETQEKIPKCVNTLKGEKGIC